ncbi:MAG: maleylacetoacetate isomerase [Halieaceae bacterium]|jgi:maleylacetoacetate isomerase
MQLFSYYRSSAAYRTRIALNLKELQYDIVPVDLTKDEQRQDAYLRENAQGLVPALKLDSGEVLTQSQAILEWLEETFPTPALYAADPFDRAGQRALCQHIACDIHPLNNLRVLRYLRNDLDLAQAQVNDWYAHWIQLGFTAIEEALARSPDNFSLGERPGMLEILLVPQVYNALRFKVPMDEFPAIIALDQRCAPLNAFQAAHPDAQPDSPAN